MTYTPLPPRPPRPFPTGTEVTCISEDGQTTKRGIVTDGHVLKSGRGKGRIEVIWIGAPYGPAYADPADLRAVPEEAK